MKKSLQEFLSELRGLQHEYRVVTGRVRRREEERSFDAYAAIPAWWRGEKRLILLVYTGGKVIVAVAPPVPHPFCVSRGADEPIEARAVDEALLEAGARYTSWCRVYYPPGFRPRSVREALGVLEELGLVDEVERVFNTF